MYTVVSGQFTIGHLGVEKFLIKFSDGRERERSVAAAVVSAE